jgi:transposase
LIAGMGFDCLKAPFRVVGNVDGEMVEKYFKEHLVKELRPEQIVVLDNASYHKRKGIRVAVEEAGCKLLFLPAYSPDLNPIEQVWSQLKRLIKKAGRVGEKSLNEMIDWAFKQVVYSDFSSYFRHFQTLISTPS